MVGACPISLASPGAEDAETTDLPAESPILQVHQRSRSDTSAAHTASSSP